VENEWQRGASQFLSKHQKDRAETHFESYYSNGSSPWFSEIQMNRRAFVSINRWRPGHSNLKASLSRFNFVSMVECECGDGLQTGEHIFWDCKLYEEQRATMIDIFSENSKKNTQIQLENF
jgi:hypothetical protein